MLCGLSYCVFDIFGCYAACHVVCSTYLDVMLACHVVSCCVFNIFGCYVVIVTLAACCVFDIFGCYVACHVVYLTYLDVMWIVILCV